jgi:hypothetical protein
MPLVNNVNLRIFLSTVPTIIGLKDVFKHPGLHDFLSTISNFIANVVIWSSMRWSTIVEFVDYILHSLTKLLHILGQYSCGKIETTTSK